MDSTIQITIMAMVLPTEVTKAISHPTGEPVTRTRETRLRRCNHQLLAELDTLLAPTVGRAGHQFLTEER
ncbi:MAG: hypothetical protein HC862_15945 [Scytonema sp. RU_4_4]|nr:hypothetical protein [Scytonema sp. RU_4_4]